MSFKAVLIVILLAKIQNASIIGIFSTAVEVVSFGIDVYNFMDDLLSEETTPTTPISESDQIINKISDRIQMSTESIVFNVELESHLSDLRDVAHAIKQLLSDMESIISAQNKVKRKVYESRFYDNFQILKNDVYKIKHLLNFKIEVSGISNTLLSLVTEEFDCGMTRFEEFQAYYMTLLSNAVALDLLNERLSETDLHDDALRLWSSVSESLIEDFKQQKDNCKRKFHQLARKDFEHFRNAKDLFENNQRKYTYKTCDVYFLSGTYCARIRKDFQYIFSKKYNLDITIALFTDKENETLISFDNFDKLSSYMTFENCKKDVASLISLLDLLDYELDLLIMYPEHEESSVKSFLDKDSNVIDTNVAAIGIAYKTLLYARKQDGNASSHAHDYDIYFNMSNNENTDESKWPLWLWCAIIGGSSVVIFIIIIVCCRCCRCCSRYRYYRDTRVHRTYRSNCDDFVTSSAPHNNRHNDYRDYEKELNDYPLGSFDHHTGYY